MPKNSCTDPVLSAYDRMWGPSSDHAGGIVQHVYGDAHVEGITDGIDPNVYLWIVTATAANRSQPRNRRSYPSAALAVGG